MLESSKVPALTRAIDILNLIARIGPCSAATIIDTLGIPKSTAYLLLNELRRQRFLSLDHQENFCLWTKLVELSGHRSEEHTSELQSRFDLVCRLLLDKKKNHIRKYG